jgi:2-iminobutanoate/2-iminopropanoate deaminase
MRRPERGSAAWSSEHILRAAGGARQDVVEVGVLANLADFAAFKEEYSKFFPNDEPARYVAKLGVDIPNIPASTRMTADTD